MLWNHTYRVQADGEEAEEIAPCPGEKLPKQWLTFAKELGISDHVNFLGYRTDAPELYKASDLFLFVTLREGLSVALMEAMSSGMPIICAEIRGNTDLVDDNISGVFTENTPEAVAQHILALYREGIITKETALDYADHPEQMHRQLG